MNILDDFKRNIKNKKLRHKIENLENTYQKLDTEEEAIKEATRKAIEEINANPEMALKILKMIEESKGLPKEVVVETIKKLPETDKIENPEQTVVRAVERLELDSKDIKEIIKDADISLSTAKEMAVQIPNEELRDKEKARLENIEREKQDEEKRIKEEQAKEKLKTIYATCENIQDTELVSLLEKSQEDLEEKVVKQIIIRICARKTALEFKRYGTARIPTMKKIISPEEMLEFDMLDIVGQEYEDIKDKKQYSGRFRYNEEILKEIILKEIAKNVAKTYKEVGILDIPQTPKIKNVINQKEDYFINQVKIYSGDEINTDQVRRKISGELETQLEDIIGMIRRLPEDEKEIFLKNAKNDLMQRVRIKTTGKAKSKNEFVGDDNKER